MIELTEEQIGEIKLKSYAYDGYKNTILQISSELTELASELISISLETEKEYSINNKRLIEKQNRAIEEYSDLKNMSERLLMIMTKIQIDLNKNGNLEKTHKEWMNYKMQRRKKQLESKGIEFTF